MHACTTYQILQHFCSRNYYVWPKIVPCKYGHKRTEQNNVLGEVFFVRGILGGKDKDKTGDSTGGAIGWGYWASTYFVE